MFTDSSRTEKENSKTEAVSDDAGGVQYTARETEGAVCDLRTCGYEQSEYIPGGRSLSYDREEQRAFVPELQSRTRKVQGQPQPTENGSKLSGEQWVIWCGLNEEQEAVADILGDDCVSIHGSLSPEEKECLLDQWLSGDVRFLVSKPRICGFGLNLQQSHKMIFFGLSYSWEQYYQCIRREWRYLQENPVDVYLVLSDIENSIYQNIMRKDAMAKRLRRTTSIHSISISE